MAPVSLSGTSFKPVVFGEGGYEGNSAVLKQLSNGQGVLVSVQQVDSSRYPFLHVDTSEPHPGIKVFFIWRTAKNPKHLHYAQLYGNEGGSHYIDLSHYANWKGKIVESSIGVFGDLRGSPFILNKVEYLPYSPSTLLRVIWGEWTAFSTWDQSSINVYRGIPKQALVSPVIIGSLWIVASIALYLLAYKLCVRRLGARLTLGKFPPTYLNLAIIVGTTWLLLHGLWLEKFLQQRKETVLAFAGKTINERKLSDWDGEYFALASKVKEAIPEEEKLAILFMGEDMKEPVPQRVRYHLLPEIRASFIRHLEKGSLHRSAKDYNYILVLWSPTNEPAKSMETLRNHLAKHHWKKTDVLNDPAGALITLEKLKK
ncbi:hypothetical protein [Parahaliea mediterranea]|uniref:Uncharacterized protein n=1 Tax=Parahaliea mediterranea TaxID=651086 RepID=A0A939IJL0_9GAMM|nr:hypothetical protein [Parahaliea mediterranea]MBN7797774.1 hypothetical protein [Parahaliea mediterranea]